VNSNGLVFINAWNEWAEGAYLEPDERLGYANLEACKMARLRAEIVKGNVEKKLTNSTLAIIVHVFYVDVFEEIIAYINKLKGNIKLYVTCQSANHAQTAALLKAQSHEFNLTVNDNHGRDVLPFLFVLNEIIKNKHQYFVKVHTKKSEHRSDGNAWRSQLFKDLLTQKTLNRNLARFNSQRLLGILVPTDHIVPMTFYLGSNEEKVLQLSHRLGVCADELLSLHFAAGTMFMARTEALLPLICLGLDGRDFEYEDGQIDGTMAHAVERVISASCYSAGLKIESVNQPTSENYQFANKTNLGYQR
jgi:lipopolysaccharide biosynthesis protein